MTSGELPLLALAPLAGFTDRAFRTLCKEGGADVLFSEMISAKAVCFGDIKTLSLASFDESERPFFLQLFGREPRDFALAVTKLLQSFSPDGFDINMGCPVPKVVKSGEGSALMQTPSLIERIVSETVKAAGKTPVSVKLRLGFDEAHKNVLECAKAAERGGASFITVHGRTREGGFFAPIDFESIATVREALSVPVFANGGITDAVGAREMLEKTGCTRLMIGRGALGRPWIFSEIKAALSSEPIPTFDAKQFALKHIQLACLYKPVSRVLPELRGALSYYLKGKNGASRTRERLMRAETRAEVEQLIEDFFGGNA